MSLFRTLAIAGALAAVASAAVAHEAKLGDLTLKDLAVKSSLKGSSTTGGYVTIVNAGARPDRLISATCACAAKVTLHNMWMDHGIMRMRLADKGMVVPAHGELKLAPAGPHLMLEGVKAPLADKTDVELTLKFERAGTVTTRFHVKSDLTAPMAAMPGMKR
jgi:hypothetical protein